MYRVNTATSHKLTPRKAGQAITSRRHNIAVFDGDGIGPEIMAPTIKLLDLIVSASGGYALNFDHLAAGAQHFLETGEALPDASLAGADKADAILLSATGLPNVRYDDGTEITPQISLRMEFDLYAGVRPVKILPGPASPLRLPEGKSVDFVLIRESTEGLFFSLGKGEVEENEARETLRITRAKSEKLFRFAFDLAQRRRDDGHGSGKVTCVDKANVFRAFAFFRKLFDEVASDHPDTEVDYAYVDAMALWMIQKPWMFDVLVTENMFGDILSDLGAGLMGGLGVAPSADIGDNHAVFQPCHGSAPDIAGEGIANPAAMILSAAMMLNWLGHKHEDRGMVADGARLQNAVHDVLLKADHLTADLGGRASTLEFAKAVEGALS